jgi:hypothetical protein
MGTAVFTYGAEHQRVQHRWYSTYSATGNAPNQTLPAALTLSMPSSPAPPPAHPAPTAAIPGMNTWIAATSA